MGERARETLAILGFCVLMVVVICVVWSISTTHYAEFKEKQVQTKTLTILHAWEEGGQYYFADELGCVYLIAYKGDLRPKREIMYDDMPKIRFEKLKEGHRYNVEYVVRQRYVRWSLGEKEMKKNE